MNIFKKSMVIISTALAMLSFATVSVASATYTDSTSYNTYEPEGYSPNAVNYHDSFWVCGTQYARHKNDDSSVYVNNTSNGEVKMDLWGKKATDETKVHVGCPSSTAAHKYKDENITVPNNGPRMLNQFIFERKLTYACVRFYSVNGGSGYWSPDTLGTYDIINKF